MEALEAAVFGGFEWFCGDELDPSPNLPIKASRKPGERVLWGGLYTTRGLLKKLIKTSRRSGERVFYFFELG